MRLKKHRNACGVEKFPIVDGKKKFIGSNQDSQEVGRSRTDRCVVGDDDGSVPSPLLVTVGSKAGPGIPDSRGQIIGDLRRVTDVSWAGWVR